MAGADGWNASRLVIENRCEALGEAEREAESLWSRRLFEAFWSLRQMTKLWPTPSVSKYKLLNTKKQFGLFLWIWAEAAPSVLHWCAILFAEQWARWDMPLKLLGKRHISLFCNTSKWLLACYGAAFRSDAEKQEQRSSFGGFFFCLDVITIYMHLLSAAMYVLFKRNRRGQQCGWARGRNSGSQIRKDTEEKAFTFL